MLYIYQAARTVACESADTAILGGVVWSSCASSEISSSISVVSVPFDVTGDGPTISLGLVICRPFGESPPSIELGCNLVDWFDSAELRADLQQNVNIIL